MTALRRLAAPAAALLVASGAAAGCGGQAHDRAFAMRSGCDAPRVSASSAREIRRALAARTDVWGAELLAAPGGPTLERARRYLAPLVLARAPQRRPLTSSGFHYVAFGVPRGDTGTADVALHVADGSQIVARRVGGRSLTVRVGRAGERYGSCRSRLAGGRYVDGWLPILETEYRDAAGSRYRQESFTARSQRTGALTSFLRVDVDAGSVPGRVRLVPSAGVADLVVEVARGRTRSIFASWTVAGAPSAPVLVHPSAYDAVRRSVVELWGRRITEGAEIDVPERAVRDALRSLLVQNQVLSWRYSIGNPYEEFSFPEGIDVARVTAEYGFAGAARAILRTSLTRRPTPYPNWKRGEKLLGTAEYYRLFRDRAYVDEVTPELRQYVDAFARQLAASPRSLLARERYSSDIPDSVLGLHSQAVVWQALRAIAPVWADTGHGSLAATATRLAAQLESGLRRAVRASQRRLPDGTLFVPVRLLDGEQPYGTVTESRPGSYWNLVMPYALASGLFAPGGAEATGVRNYMLRHGSRLLGLVRAGGYALYGLAGGPRTGTDQVYGNNVARFLADRDEPEQLVLSLYGSLAAAMAPGTFVAGEAASVAPLGDSPYRSTYLPPNGAANAAFLETVRLMLIHETRGRDAAPAGLELAFATPRSWLRPGRRIGVRRVPTSFGTVSFSLTARAASVDGWVEMPNRPRARSVRLRIRVPVGRRVTAAFVAGRRVATIGGRRETIDLSRHSGRVAVVVLHAPRHA